MRKNVVLVFICLLILVYPPDFIIAQSSVDVECGDIIEAELTSTMPSHSYKLEAPAGTQLNIGVQPIGVSLNPYLALFDDSNNVITRINSFSEGEAESLSNFVVSTSNPEIVILGDRNGSTIRTNFSHMSPPTNAEK